MKKSIVFSALVAVGLAGFSTAASGNDQDENVAPGQERYYHPPAVDKLMAEVNHLNHMMTHVERLVRTLRAPQAISRKYEHVRQEAASVNSQLRSKAIDRVRLRSEIERMHKELHQIEEELHVPAQQQYSWR
ncbi:MAG: hypothetical protein QOG51_150 [Verrucomicrobiota bacterium]|jgi:chromosome segregation ATPase